MKIKLNVAKFKKVVRSMSKFMGVKEFMFPDENNVLIYIITLYFYLVWLCVFPVAIIIALLVLTEIDVNEVSND